MRKTVTAYLIIVLFLAFMFLPAEPGALAKGTSQDDLFGFHFDPSYVPSNTQGIQVSYSSNSSGIILTSGAAGWCTGTGSWGWVDPVDNTLRTTGGWILQGGPGLGRDSSGNYQWYVGWGRFDATGSWVCGTIATISASTYPTLSGWAKIYFTGSAWVLQVYVSQNGQTYSHTFESNIGSYVSSANNDWDAVETSYQQQGVTFPATFNWAITQPKFLMSGTWYNWNFDGGTYKEMDVFITFQPSKSGNTVGVQKVNTRGVKIYIGPSLSDGTEIDWCVSGTCPKVPG